MERIPSINLPWDSRTISLPLLLVSDTEPHPSKLQWIPEGYEEAENQVYRKMEASRLKTRYRRSIITQMSDNDIIHRRALYAIGVLSKEELDEIAKANEEAAAAEEDEDDE